MIIYIFNNFFPDNGGFSKRCKKEIDIISKIEDVVILCRGKDVNVGSKTYISETKNEIPIYTFYPFFSVNKNIVNYDNKIGGLYEIVRNIGLSSSIISALFKILIKYRGEKIKLYSVVSPLTVPLIAHIVGSLFRTLPQVVEFHDLEPEMAIHLKNLKNNSLVLRIEYLLEKIVCKLYKNVIVTSKIQSGIIANRTKINLDKIIYIPNSIQVDKVTGNKIIKMPYFNIGYISSFSYIYNVEGLIKLLKNIKIKKRNFKNIKFTIVGDGELLPLVINKVKSYKLEKLFIFTGKLEKVNLITQTFDIAMIPWVKNEMTQIILPTKLFEYFESEKSVIAPNFGEFKLNLKNQHNAALYNNISNLADEIIKISHNHKKLHDLNEYAYRDYKNNYKHSIFEAKIINLFK